MLGSSSGLPASSSDSTVISSSPPTSRRCHGAPAGPSTSFSVIARNPMASRHADATAVARAGVYSLVVTIVERAQGGSASDAGRNGAGGEPEALETTEWLEALDAAIAHDGL